MNEPMPLWQNRSAYLPLLFLILLMPWAAFAVIVIAGAMHIVQPLFYFYLVMMVFVFFVGIRLIKERPSLGLYKAVRVMVGVSALPTFIAGIYLVSTLEAAR
ncbi:hypothetical protein [Sphingomicrobium sediminis]|uniref:Uncharacterized protein n=1 Tax=Sphingomicrobium sediminis TaxID=2950949 RepID=A0A9X2J3V9_9SPHN|nr:hypothetical protein [Sphingomicrobium sediminis]MCM8557726.1 hypothetical protein [Sphingomicrobium sediminis]